jgi:hypothetical protein
VRQRYGDVDDTKPRRVAKGAVAGLCATAALTHVLLVFLHVAPSNPVSQRYQEEINAWISPFFEQNWLLFAPNPEANRTQIFARTGWSTESGEQGVSDWFDITAADDAAITHNLYPSRTNQSMLRRAWSAYQWSHGDSDESTNEWALLRAENLRNIAVQRVAGVSPQPFQVIRLKVVTQPIAAPGDTPQTGTTEPFTRLLPWWKVPTDGS